MHSSDFKTKRIALAALFAAVALVVTMLVRVPIPSTSGYINLGDSVIYAAALLLGGPLAAVAAAVGSALADLFVGAAVYAPATALIKALMALAVGAVLRRKTFARSIAAAVISGVIMVCGYLLYELLVFGAAYAVVGVPMNCIQGALCAVVSVLLFGILRKLKPQDL